MIQGILLVLELCSVIVLTWHIVRSVRPGAKRSLGLFDFKRNKADMLERKAKKPAPKFHA